MNINEVTKLQLFFHNEKKSTAFAIICKSLEEVYTCIEDNGFEYLYRIAIRYSDGSYQSISSSRSVEDEDE